jgi:hypothetical protein
MPGQPKSPPPPRPGRRTFLQGRRLTGDLAVGTVIAATESASELIAVAGCSSARVRVKQDADDAELTVELCDQDGVPYSEGAMQLTGLVADEDDMVDIAILGESYILVTLTAPAGGPATVTFVDVAARTD